MAYLTLRRPWRVVGILRPRHSADECHREAVPAWPRWRWVCAVRAFLQLAVGIPILRVSYRIDVRGAENFRAVRVPCLIVSNHNMHPDWAMLMTAMPGKFRRQVILAAAADDIYGNRLQGLSASLVGNAFPFAKAGNTVRESLEFVAARIGEGWSVLIFPEGKLTTGGAMEPFKPGIGWLVAHTGVEVLPMRVEMLKPGVWDDNGKLHKRGHVRVNVAPPVQLDARARYSEVAAVLEEAVRKA